MRTRCAMPARETWWITGLLALGGCGTEVSEAVQGLAVQITGPKSGDNPFDDPNAKFIALVAEGPGISSDPAAAPQTVQPLVKTGMQLGIPAVPYGKQRQVRVEIYSADANGQPAMPVLGRGRTAPKDIEAGKTFLVTAFVSRTNAFSEPTSNAGAPAMTDQRVGAATARLPDGNVLIAGGAGLKADIKDPFDPASLASMTKTLLLYDAGERVVGNLSAAASAPMLSVGRALMATAAGPDGQVVFAGGYAMGDLGPVASNLVEYWDHKELRVRQSSAAKPHLDHPRAHHTMTRLFDDDAYYFVAGGTGPDGKASQTWEIWHPTLGAVAQGPLSKPRWNHAAVRLPVPDGGYVTLIGGENNDGTIADFEVIRYDRQGNVSFLGNTKKTCYCGNTTYAGADSNDKCAALVNQPDCQHFSWEPLVKPFEPGVGRTMPAAAFMLTPAGDGFIWIAGGFADKARTQPINRVELFRLKDGAWVPGVPAMEAARGAPMVDMTIGGAEQGRLVVVGGIDATGQTVPKGEVYVYEVAKDGSATVRREWTDNGVAGGGRVLGAAVALRTGHVAVIGGATNNGGAFAAATQMGLYNPR